MDQCKNDVILEDIKNYSKHIDEFRSQANSQGIWLFISTLGCWSVNIPLIQIIAAILLFCIFIFNSKQEMTDKRTFHKIEKDIENDIDSQERVSKNDWTNYTQTGAYSFNAVDTNYVDWTKAPAYVSGSLIWGSEPN